MTFEIDQSLAQGELRGQIYVKLMSLDVIEPSKETVLLAQLIEVYSKCNVSFFSSRVMISLVFLLFLIFQLHSYNKTSLVHLMKTIHTGLQCNNTSLWLYYTTLVSNKKTRQTQTQMQGLAHASRHSIYIY